MSPSSIPKTIVALGWAMMFSSSSYIMVLGIFGVYLKSIGETQTTIGILEGSVEALSFLMKLFSGVFSDILHNRRLLIVIGYAIVAISSPMIAFSTTFLSFLMTPFVGGALGRICNRVGNGIWATPRDALIGDVAPPNKRGQSFGLARSMGTFGSIMGSILAYVAMQYFGFTFEGVFFLSIIPIFLGLVIVLVYAKDPVDRVDHVLHKKPGFRWSSVKKLGIDFVLLMIVNIIFMLSRLGETAMSLHATINFNLPGSYVPIIYVIYNMGYTLSSYPIGFLADRTNRETFLMLGIFSLVLADLIFFAARDISEFWIGVILWGVQIGITTNIFTSIIVDITPKELHGTALGTYHILSAACVLVAESYAGYIAEIHGNRYAYLTSALIASLSLLFLVIIIKYRGISKRY